MTSPSHPLPSDPKELEALLAALPLEDQQEISELLLAGDPSQTLWTPNPGPQQLAYDSTADVLLYGGAAGGGKSDLVLGLALTKHHRSMVVRIENTNNRGLIDRTTEILNTQRGWNSQNSRWKIPVELTPSHFPSNLRESCLLEFASTPNPGDEQKHQGIPHDLLAFDEAAQFPECIIRYLMTWNRSAHTQHLRSQVVLTSNPPTPAVNPASARRSSGLWLVKMFAPWLDPSYTTSKSLNPLGLPPAEPGELRWYATYNGAEREVRDDEPFMVNDPEPRLIVPKSRTFIPAKVTDNPYYLRDSAYLATLQSLPDDLRPALLDGDFGVSLADRPMQLVPNDWLAEAVRRHTPSPGRPLPSSVLPMSVIAADVSRGGADTTVIATRYNGWCSSLSVHPGKTVPDGPTAAGLIVAQRRNDADIVVDANGVGASCYDHLTSQGIPAFGHVGSRKTSRRDRSGRFGFANMRSLLLWNLRELLDPANPLSQEIALPDDPDLLQEIQAHTWEERSGQIVVLEKKKVQENIGRSPDKCDAVAMAYYYGPPVARLQNLQGQPLVQENSYARSPQQRLSGYRKTNWDQPLSEQL